MATVTEKSTESKIWGSGPNLYRLFAHCAVRGSALGAALYWAITPGGAQTITIPSSSSEVQLQLLDPVATSFDLPVGNTVASPATGISSNATRDWTLTIHGTVSAATATALNLNSQTVGGLTVDNFGSVSAAAGRGVVLGNGGQFTNRAGATVTAANDAVYSNIAAMTVINDGTITSTGLTGVYFGTGGTFTQSSTGTVSGIHGLAFNSGSFTGNNAGQVTATAGFGVIIGVAASGTFTNDVGASITATADAISSGNAGTTIVNRGAISSNNLTGIYFGAGGTFSQSSTGTVSAVHGVIFNNGTLSGNNAGQINATTGWGLWARGNATGTFTNEAGATISTTGVNSAVFVQGTANLTLVNNGQISASSSSSGINVAASTARADITNTGNVAGGIGIDLAGDSSSLTNSGAINGSGGTAIRLTGNTIAVMLKGGTSLTGDIVSSGAGNTVTLQENGSVNGNMSGLAALVATVGSGQTWTLGGTVATIGTTATTLDVQSGTLILTNALTHGGAGGGTTVASGAILQLGNGGAGGSVTGDIVDNGRLIFNRSDNVSYAGTISGTGDVTKLGTGTLTLTANHSVTGIVTIDGGSLALSGGGQMASAEKVVANATFDISGVTAGASVRRLAGSGTVDLGAQTLTLTAANDLFSGVIQGTGGFIVAGGTQTLSGANTYSGTTQVDSGATLRAGAANTLSSNSNHVVSGNATLDLGGFNQTVSSLDNAGLVHVGGAPGTVLTVTGNYIGSGGILSLNTNLGDSSSLTDKLVVQGNTSGTTGLSITNVNGGGAETMGDGIQVIQVGGVSGGTYTLANRAAAGAYEYLLFQGGVGPNTGDGNWYLRSTLTNPSVPDDKTDRLPNFRVEVPLYAALPAFANRFGLSMLGTYRDRYGSSPLLSGCEGDVRSTLCREQTFQWGRVFGKTGHVGFGGSTPQARLENFRKDGPSYDFDLGGLQAGMDISRKDNPNGSKDAFGLYIGAGRATGDVKTIYAGPVGSVSMNGFSVGGYWTHQTAQGWYLDTVVQGTHFTSINADSALGQNLDTNGWGFIASIEGGVPVVFDAGWTVEPQAQMIYQRTSLDRGSDMFGRVYFDETDTFYGRLGARVAKTWTLSNGTMVVTWTQADVWHAFGDDKATTTFTGLLGTNPVSIGTSLGGTWAQFALGASSQIAPNAMVFASGDYGISLDSSSGHSFGGRIGLKMTW